MEKKVTVLIVILAFLILGNSALAATARDWLLSQQNATTGLLVSYEGDSNATAYTYDQACAVIALTCENDTTHAKKILDKIAALQNTDGSWYTAYNANTGTGTNLAKDTGNNSWMILAINYYTVETGDQTYINSAKKSADFILTLQDNNSSNPTFGSIRGRPDASWISTEHQHDAYSALTGLGNILSNQYYNDKASLVYNWTINNMWNDTEGRFYTGYNDYSKYLDPQSWSLPSIGTTGPAGQNFIRCLTWAYNNMHVTKTYNGQTIDGFDYDGSTTYPSGGIWFEGTEQMVLAYDIIGDTTSADYFHNQTAKAQSANGGIICATGDGGIYWPTNFPINAVAATSWYIFGSQNPRVNPFKPIPPAPDTMPPVISNILTSNITATSATITWSTDENSDSQVEYGLTTDYGNSSPLDTNLVLNHSVNVSGLSANTVYHYRVHSKDAAGNTATSGDYTFSTSPEIQTKDYSPTAIVLTKGTTGNSYSNLNSNDGIYVTVKAAKSGSYYYTDWYAKTQISESPSKVTKLSITYDGHYSTSRPQEIFLYNFVSSVWARIDYQTIGTTDKTITYTTTNASEITSYISSTGEIRLRIYTSRNRTYYCYADYIKFNIAFTSGASMTSATTPAAADPINEKPETTTVHPTGLLTYDLSINGQVKDLSGNGIKEANVVLTETHLAYPITTITDDKGYYTFRIPKIDNSKVTITANKSGYYIQNSINLVDLDNYIEETKIISEWEKIDIINNQDFIGYSVYSISGYVRSSNNIGLKDVTITLTGDKTLTYTTTNTGYYEFTELPTGNYTVLLAKTGYTFKEVSKTYTSLAANQENQDFAGVPVIIPSDDVKILGRENGYVNPAKGEKAQIVVNGANSGSVEIKVYDLGGNLVWKTEKDVTANNIEIITWDGENNDGEQVASGIYIAHISGTGINQTKKIAIIK